MSLYTNTITKRNASKIEKVLEVEEQIERVEEDIRKLKIDFEIYFNGGTKRAPHQAKASLEARSNKLNGNRNLSFAQRYKLNNLLARYNSYRELWRRRLKSKGEDVR